MAQNDDFKDFMFKGVELAFPRLKDCYRFNSATKKSEPCAQNVTNAAWSAGMKMPKDRAKEFFVQMKAHYEACRERNKKLPEFTKVFGMKKDDENGTVTFEAKKKGVTGEGKANKAPTVIDNLKNPLAEDKLEFWSGTTANVRVRAFPTVDPEGKGGISLLLDVVQVLKPIYGSANLDGFDEEDVAVGPAEFSGDPFAAAAANKKTAKANDDAFGDF
jgi:hypothetical protein